MITTEEAEAIGWEGGEVAPDGTQFFFVVDEAGVTKNFGFDPEGNFFWLPDTLPPAQVEEPPFPPETPPPPIVEPPVPTWPIFTPPPEPPIEPPAPQIPYTPEPIPLPPVTVTPNPSVDTEGTPANTSPIMSTTAHSLIDEAGWEILWDTDNATGGTVDGSVRLGRPPVTHSDIDTAGNEHLWETAFDGSGIYNLRFGRMDIYGNGTNRPNPAPVNPSTGEVDRSKPAIQVGVAFDGSPVWQIQDRVGTIVQWVLRNGVAVYDAEHPSTYGAMIETNNTRAPAGNSNQQGGGGGGGVVDLSQPQIQVGTTAGGQPVYQLVDRLGVVQQWFLTAAGITDLHQVPTYRVMHHTAATDNAGASASLAKPVIQVWTTAMGYPVKQLVDEAGVALQWIERPGNDDRRTVPHYGTLVHTALTDEQPGGGQIPTTPAKNNSSMWLGIAAVAGIGLIVLRRRAA